MIPCTDFIPAYAQEDSQGQVQSLTGQAAPGAGSFYLLPNLKRGQTLYVYAQGTSGNLDPLLLLSDKSLDRLTVGEDFRADVEQAIAAGRDPLEVVPEFADRYFLAWDDDSGQGYAAALEYTIPARGLIGFQTEFMTSTSGTGLMYHVFDHYGPAQKGGIAPRKNGVLISNGQGKVLGFALFNLQERGRMFAAPGDEVYEGQIVGIHTRDNDLVVNPLKGKQLTNMRASGKDEAISLVPPIKFTLEQALEFIEDDELIEITPASIRLRKRFLKEHERKRASRTREREPDPGG